MQKLQGERVDREQKLMEDTCPGMCIANFKVMGRILGIPALWK
jgi:hypothetical protein